MKLHYGVIGTGPVGRIFAGLLQQSGCEVSVLCHRHHALEVLQKKPVEIHGAVTGTAKLNALYSSTAEFVAAKPDVILICTKSTDSKHLLRALRDLGTASKTIFVSCQNGLDTEKHIDEVFGPGRGLRMVLNMGCSVVCGNQVQVNFFMTHFLSQRQGVDPVSVNQIAADLNAANIMTEVSENYRLHVFRKVLLNSSLGAFCAVTRHTMSCVMGQPEARSMIRKMVAEGVEIARAEGIEFGEEFVPEAMRYLDQGGNHKPSILVDVEKGRPTENETHCGELARLAKLHGIKADLIDTIAKLIRSVENC